jgi:hypothetical protein
MELEKALYHSILVDQAKEGLKWARVFVVDKTAKRKMDRESKISFNLFSLRVFGLIPQA